MLQIGFSLHDRYRVTRQVASGGGGNVYEAVDFHTSQIVALKECFLPDVTYHDEMNRVVVKTLEYKTVFEQHVTRFLEEGKLLKSMDHPNVVKVFDVFMENGTAYYVMELLTGTPLSNLVANTGRGLEVKVALNILNQLMKAVEDVHRYGFLHLDIKPANVMVDMNGRVKLIDFGSARDMKNLGKLNTHFTPAYAPQELHFMTVEDIGVWSDMYAIGATFYYMLTAMAPPLYSDITEKGEDAFRFSERIPYRLQKLIVWMMMPAKEIRPTTYQQVVHFVNHGKLPSMATNPDATLPADKKQEPEDDGQFVSVGQPQEASVRQIPQTPPQPHFNPQPQSKPQPIPQQRPQFQSNKPQPVKKQINMPNNLPRKSNKLGLAILLAIVIVAILLYSAVNQKLLPMGCNRQDDNESDEENFVEENVNDDTTSAEKRLYEKLVILCDRTKEKLKTAKKKDDVALIIKHFDNQCNEQINKSNVDLTGDYYKKYKKKVDEVLKFAEKKKAEIIKKQEEEKRRREEEEMIVLEQIEQEAREDREQESVFVTEDENQMEKPTKSSPINDIF